MTNLTHELRDLSNDLTVGNSKNPMCFQLTHYAFWDVAAFRFAVRDYLFSHNPPMPQRLSIYHLLSLLLQFIEDLALNAREKNPTYNPLMVLAPAYCA